jgi:glyoxylase-like metal-dependent hydrolase (beta-lactamase superfamily II)
VSGSDETPRPPPTPEFGAVKPDGPSHHYPPIGTAAVTKFSVGPFDNNVYVVRCNTTGKALVIDGSAGPERVVPELGDAEPVGILITHNHPDHLAGLTDLARALNVPVYAHPADAGAIPVRTEPVEDGDELDAGTLVVRTLHTPGHTPGAMCYVLDGMLLAGDTLFPGGPGATGGDAAAVSEIMRSLDRLFAELPDETRVSPGHGLDTTIGRERPYVEAWRRRGW